MPGGRGRPKHVALFFEGPPHWLGVIRPTDVTCIDLWSTSEGQIQPDTVWHTFLTGLGSKGRVKTIRQVSEESDQWQDVDFLLGCGTAEFIQKTVPFLEGVPALSLITSGGRPGRTPRRIPPTVLGWKWVRLSHLKTGGCTTGAYLLGFRNLARPAPPP